jgi:tetratricopeptide (TPR) repeat protein
MLDNEMIEQIRSLNRSGKYNEALDVINRIEKKDRYHFYEAAKAYIAINNYDESINNINEVLSLKGDWVGAAGVKILALYRSNKVEDIGPTFLKLINNYSNTSGIEKDLAIIFNNILDYKIDNIFVLLNYILDHYSFKFGADDFYNFYQGIINSNTEKMELASRNFNSISDFSKFGRHATGGASFKFCASL